MMNPDFSSHAANGVNVKTENQCDSKNLIESIESNTFGYSDLSNKILDAQTMIKDAIKLSQQLILYNNVGTMSFSFDFVAGPLGNHKYDSLLTYPKFLPKELFFCI